MSVFRVAVPIEIGLMGTELATQAVHWGVKEPFALSNARDLVIGF